MEKVTIKTRTASGKWIFAIAFTFLFQLTILASDTEPGDFGGGDNPMLSINTRLLQTNQSRKCFVATVSPFFNFRVVLI